MQMYVMLCFDINSLLINQGMSVKTPSTYYNKDSFARYSCVKMNRF